MSIGPDYTILALDLATQTGWAQSRLDGAGLVSGSVRLRGKEPEEKGAHLQMIIMDHFKVMPFHHLIYEGAVPTSHLRGKTNVDTTYTAYGFPIAVGSTAINMGFPISRVLRVKVNDWRRHFIGTTSAGDRKETKRAVIARCRQLGWNPADDNEADALGILDYQRALLSPRYSASSGPLFTA